MIWTVAIGMSCLAGSFVACCEEWMDFLGGVLATGPAIRVPNSSDGHALYTSGPP
jgi:hypothetical protein